MPQVSPKEDTKSLDGYHDCADYSKTIACLRQCGFPLALPPLATTIQKAITRVVDQLATNSTVFINTPDQHHHASTILAAISESPGVRVSRSAWALVEAGACSFDDVLSVWPTVSENAVADYLVAKLETPHSDSTSQKGHHVIEDIDVRLVGDPAAWRTSFSQFSAVLETVLEPSELNRAVMAFLRAQDLFPHPLEHHMRRFKEQFPTHWAKICSNRGSDFSQGLYNKDILTLLLRDIPKERLYRALRWVAAERIKAGGDLSKILFGPTDAPENDPDDFEQSLQRRFQCCNLPEYRDLTTRERAAALLAMQHADLSFGHDWVYEWAPSPYDYRPSTVFADIIDTIVDDGRPPHIQVWAHLFRKTFGQKIDCAADLDRAQKSLGIVLHSHRGQTVDLYGRFLYDRTGRVSSPSSSGDFHTLRLYRPGDDPRLIGWRSSARSDKTFVREGREREAWPVHFLADIDWLLEDSHRDELFKHLILAERQGVDFSLSIIGRVHFGTFNDLVSPNRTLNTFRTQGFLDPLGKQLGSYLSYVDNERQIFGYAGYPGINPFDSFRAELPRKSLLIAAIARKNRDHATGTLSSLVRSGWHVRVLTYRLTKPATARGEE